MSTPRIAIAGAAVVILSVLDHAGLFAHPESDQSRYNNAVATVIHVADGDTFDIDIPDGDASVTRIRLWGIDCPEIAHETGRSDGFYGRDAADFVQEHLEGRRIRIALDPNRPSRGKYGRLLAYAFLEDTDEMLNEVLLQEGLAYADRRFDHVFALRFRDLERRAVKARRGLWESVKASQMPAWRRRMMDAGIIKGR